MEQAPSANHPETTPTESSAPVANKVRVQPRGTMRRAMIASFGLFLLTVLAALFGVRSGPAILGWLLGWTLLLSPLATCLAPILGMIRFPAGKLLSARGNDLVLERFGRTHHIPSSQLKEGWYSPSDKKVHFVTNGDNEYTASVDDAATGQALIERAGVDASKRTLRVRLGPVDFLNAMLILVGPAVSLYLADKITDLFAMQGIYMLPLFLVLFVLEYFLVHKLIGPAHLTIGADGIIVEQRFGKQFIPFERIRNVKTSDNEVLLDLVDGTQFRAQARNLFSDTQAMISERIKEALAVREKQSAELNALAALDRGRRDGAEWRKAMSGLLDKNRGYRVAPLTREQVVSVLSDPSAPADRRLGAAIALAKSGDEEAPARIRIAASASANQKVRIALESIAAGEIENAAIDEAAEEEARREASS